MGRSTNINYFSLASIDLHKLAGVESHVFNNDDISIVLNGKPSSSTFFAGGQIYQVPEPRLLLVINGDADVYLDLEQYHLAQGMAVLTTPDMILEFERFSPDAMVCGLALKEHIHVAESIVSSTSPKDFELLLRMLYLIWDIANETPFRRDTVMQMVQAMISNLHYVKQSASDSSLSDNPTRSQQLFRMFKTLVNQHCERERNIPFYADRLHITPHHLSAVVSQASGHSVMYWVNRAVILRAKVLLHTNTMMTYEIAERLNFANPPAFNNFFKRETGMTPKEYQNQK